MIWGLVSHGRGCDCDPCFEASKPRKPHPDTLCRCCGAEDEPNEDGPAVSTGWCHACQDAECGEQLVGAPCRAVTS